MQYSRKQTGFTVVELLIVIVIIGILAGISFAGYSGLTGKARSVAVANSLDHAASEVQRVTLRGSVPTSLPSTIKPDNDIVLQLAGSAGGVDDFCINAYRISSFEIGSYDSKHGKIRPGLCPGILIGSPLGGSLPSVPMNENLTTPDFEDWDLTGSVTYDKTTKELTFSGASGWAVSPLVYLGGQSVGSGLTYELYSTTGSTTFAPQAGVYSSSNYYAANGTTSATSSSGYTGNGNAQPVPLSAWTSRTWVTGTGPNIQYVRYTIYLSPGDYTSNNFKIRNPSIDRRP